MAEPEKKLFSWLSLKRLRQLIPHDECKVPLKEVTFSAQQFFLWIRLPGNDII